MNLPRQNDHEFIRSAVRPPYGDGRGEVTLVDLFSGCGGMALGVAQAAYQKGDALRVSLAVDEDADAVKVFAQNFEHTFLGAGCTLGDVCDRFDGAFEDELTPTERSVRASAGVRVDFLVGGPPCQGNSNLNNHTRRNDPRNALYARMARAARVLEPRFVVVENVPDVLSDRGRVVDVTREALERDGYQVADAVLDLWTLGVPQRRRRHVLFASREDAIVPDDVLRALQEHPGRDGRDVRWAIADLMDMEAEDGFDRPSVSTQTNLERMRWLFDNDAYELPNRLRPPCHQGKSHTYKSVYGRLRWDRPAQTVTTGFGSMGQGRYVHPAECRTITPHEAARLQCFPDFFTFGATSKRGAWARLIGNAVPPLLTMRIAEYALGSVRSPATP